MTARADSIQPGRTIQSRYGDGRMRGVVIDWTDVRDDATGEIVRRWHVVGAPAGRVAYFTIAQDEVDWAGYTGDWRPDVLRGLETRLRRAVADDHGDDRHLRALNRIHALIETGGES